MPTNRLIWIDITKGLCILGIVLFHFFQNYHDNLKFSEYLGIQGAKIGFAAVDIFFVVAGFNISYSLAATERNKQIKLVDINLFDWLKRKFIRLYPSYWLAFLLTLIIYIIFDHSIQIELSLKTIFLFFGLTTYQYFKVINPGFWFFSVIVQAFLLVPLILSITKFQSKKILWIGIIIGSIEKIVFGLAYCFVDNDYLHYFLLQNNFIGSYFFQFCLGLYSGFIYYKNQRFSRQDFRYSFILFSLGILVYILSYILKIDVIYKAGVDICFTPIFFLICYCLFDQNSQKKKSIIESNMMQFLSLLGCNSYQIYLLHQPLFFVGLPPLIDNIFLPPYFKLSLVGIIIFACLFFYVIYFTKLELLIKKHILKAI